MNLSQIKNNISWILSPIHLIGYGFDTFFDYLNWSLSWILTWSELRLSRVNSDPC